MAHTMINYVGIDLGTSSVKVLKRYADGRTEKVREPYAGSLPGGWRDAVLRALCRIGLQGTAGIGLASQVGTYVVDGAHIIGWNSPAGSEEIDGILALCDGDTWDDEICMRHPHLVSYPLPRLAYIKKHWPGAREVCQPKDWLLRELTGTYVSDPYSWRGLCRLPEGRYSRKLMELADVDPALLPPIVAPDAAAGRTRRIAFDGGEIPAGIPVYTGLNDFFASLLGMGMAEGELFDITGTSEHLGVIEANYRPDDRMVNGPWLRGFAHYGVTACSGPSLQFCGRLDGAAYRCPDIEAAAKLLDEMAAKKPPVFLPYLNGERAPIWNADARGVFFGLSADCGTRELAYAAMEGVCFSIAHVHEALGSPSGTALKLSGGASENPLMNLLKAEMFDLPATNLSEPDTTALGAAMVAMVGDGRYAGYAEAARAECRAAGSVAPVGRWREWLEARYGVYKCLYPALRASMLEWRNIK